jgi:hypothetical protein
VQAGCAVALCCGGQSILAQVLVAAAIRPVTLWRSDHAVACRRLSIRICHIAKARAAARGRLAFVMVEFWRTLDMWCSYEAKERHCCRSLRLLAQSGRERDC